jgi:hypothetical protein
MRCDPEAILLAPSHSHHNVSPRWLLGEGVQKRLGASTSLGETRIMARQGRDQEVRTLQRSIWMAHREISHGFMAMVMTSLELTNETKTASLKPLPIIWPGMEAAMVSFDADVNMTLEDGGAEVFSPIISGALPDPSQNDLRVRSLPFCAQKTMGDVDMVRIDMLAFYKELRKAAAFGGNFAKAWWGSTWDAWGTHAQAKCEQIAAGSKGSIEEDALGLRAWTRLRRPLTVDRWDWFEATETTAFDASYMRIQFLDAPTIRDCLRKGFETCFVPLALHVLPAIATSGRLCDSCDNWVDSRLGGEGDSPCPTRGCARSWT